ADLVLDRTRDADGDVELGRDALPRLADLGRVRIPTGVDNRSRCSNSAAERLRELLHELEVLRPAEPATSGDDHLGLLERRPLALGVRLLDHGRGGGEILQLEGGLGNFRLAPGLLRIESAGAEER